MRKATLDHLFRHLSPTSKLVMRVDFNVPIKSGKVVDPNRIVSKFSDTKVLSPQFKIFWITNPNHWFSCPITEDPMVRELPKTHSNPSLNLWNRCLEEEFIFLMTVSATKS